MEGDAITIKRGIRTLGTEKVEITINEIAHSELLYRDGLKTLDCEFGHPHAVVSAQLNKISFFSTTKTAL